MAEVKRNDDFVKLANTSDETASYTYGGCPHTIEPGKFETVLRYIAEKAIVQATKETGSPFKIVEYPADQRQMPAGTLPEQAGEIHAMKKENAVLKAENADLKEQNESLQKELKKRK